MNKHHYTTLWVLLAVALLPLGAATLMYFGGFGVPAERVNHGRLVLDEAPLPSWRLQDEDGRPWDGRGQWQLLQVDHACEHRCQHWRESLPRLHKALGRERHRVETQWVVTGAATQPAGKIAEGALHPVIPLNTLDEGIWVADPLGNLVLYYGYDHSPRELLDDLKRLLKVSKVG